MIKHGRPVVIMLMSPHTMAFGFCIGRSKAFKAARKRDMAFLSPATPNTDFLAVSLSRRHGVFDETILSLL
jgi:hypothetical protein